MNMSRPSRVGRVTVDLAACSRCLVELTNVTSGYNLPLSIHADSWLHSAVVLTFVKVRSMSLGLQDVPTNQDGSPASTLSPSADIVDSFFRFENCIVSGDAVFLQRSDDSDALLKTKLSVAGDSEPEKSIGFGTNPLDELKVRQRPREHSGEASFSFNLDHFVLQRPDEIRSNRLPHSAAASLLNERVARVLDNVIVLQPAMAAPPGPAAEWLVVLMHMLRVEFDWRSFNFSTCAPSAYFMSPDEHVSVTLGSTPTLVAITTTHPLTSRTGSKSVDLGNTITPEKSPVESSASQTPPDQSATHSISVSQFVPTLPPPTSQPTAEPSTLSPPPRDTEAPSVKAVVIEAVKEEKKAVEATTSTVVLTSAVSSSGGGGSAQDLQALVVLGGMACAATAIKTVASGGEQSVSPFQLFDGSLGVLAGNFIVTLGVALLQLLLAFIYAKAKSKPFIAGCARLRFPAWTFTVFVLLYQGTTLSAFKALFGSDSAVAARVVGVVVIFLCIMVPAIAPTLLFKRIWRPQYVKYRHVFANLPRHVRRIVLPTGFYNNKKAADPTRVVPRFNALFSTLRNGLHPFYLLIPFVKAFLVSFIAALPGSSPNCAVRFGMAGFIYFASAVLSLTHRPHRVGADNIFSCVSNALIGAVCAFGATQSADSSDTKLASLLMVSSAVSMLWMVWGIVIKLAEYFRWKPNEWATRNKARSGDRTANEEEGSSDEDSDSTTSSSDDDIGDCTAVEMSSTAYEEGDSQLGHLVVPLNPLHDGDEEDEEEEDSSDDDDHVNL